VNAATLSGKGVLITRPAGQSDKLVEAVRNAGGEPFCLPVIKIVARPADKISREAAALPDPDIVVFVSSNAVVHGFAYAATPGATVAAIGPATRDALLSMGCEVDVYPRGRYDSEHLLAEPQMLNVAGKCIRIVRGDRGRELLADTLRQRDASIHYLSVYERRSVNHSADELGRLEVRLQGGKIDFIVVMSVDSLRSLLASLPQSMLEALRKTPLVTPSERVIQTASELLPDATLQLAAGPGPEDIVQALVASVPRQ
jgi:uroporphyrinogen-III synthase